MDHRLEASNSALSQTSRAISPVFLKKKAGKIYRFPLAGKIIHGKLT